MAVIAMLIGLGLAGCTTVREEQVKDVVLIIHDSRGYYTFYLDSSPAPVESNIGNLPQRYFYSMTGRETIVPDVPPGQKMWYRYIRTSKAFSGITGKELVIHVHSLTEIRQVQAKA